MSFTVAIVGRPNVGKSTLFNRLVGARRALVDPDPRGDPRPDHRRGADRPSRVHPDRHRRPGRRAAGKPGGAAARPDRRRARRGRRRADADRRQERAHRARPALRPLAAPPGHAGRSWWPTSARAWPRRAWRARPGASGSGRRSRSRRRTAKGSRTSRRRCSPMRPRIPTPRRGGQPEARPLRLAIAGRPNVGKSSLINRLLADERLLTGPEPGLTRDAVTIRWQWQGRRDRAGRYRRAAPPGADRARRPRAAVQPIGARRAA